MELLRPNRVDTVNGEPDLTLEFGLMTELVAPQLGQLLSYGFRLLFRLEHAADHEM